MGRWDRFFNKLSDLMGLQQVYQGTDNDCEVIMQMALGCLSSLSGNSLREEAKNINTLAVPTSIRWLGMVVGLLEEKEQ